MSDASCVRLRAHHHSQLLQLLGTDPLMNTFLLGAAGQEDWARTAMWWGVAHHGRMLAAVYLSPGHLAVPFAPEVPHAERLGQALRKAGHVPCMVVGPREASDALWQAWTSGRTAATTFDQRLYVTNLAGIRSHEVALAPASEAMWEQVALNAARMQFEDLGLTRFRSDPEDFFSQVHDQVTRGRYLVLTEGDDIVFQVQLGIESDQAIQIGGTYVPEPHRGRGHAHDGMRQLLTCLTGRHGYCTLHVREDNAPAVRTYEHAGFVRGGPMRILLPR